MMTSRYLPVLFLCLALLIVPASAKIVITAEPYGLGIEHHLITDSAGTTYDAMEKGKAIQRITVDAPIGTQVDYTLYYSNGSSVSGTAYYHDSSTLFGFGYVTSDMTLGGLSSSYTYFSNTGIGRLYLYGYAKNETSPGTWEKGFVVAGTTLGATTFDNDVIFYPVTAGNGVINKFSFTSNRAVNVDVITNDYSATESAVGTSYIDAVWQWINFAISIGSTIYSLATTIFFVLKFLFWDNLVLTIALYIGITGAIAFQQTRDIFSALRKFFGYQMSMVKLLLQVWESFINLLNSFSSIFKI